jgi:hypothetical protein
MHCRFRTLTFLSQILRAVEAIIKQVDGSEAHIAFPKRSTFVANDVLGIAWWGSYCRFEGLDTFIRNVICANEIGFE